jgi:glycosyltransferase involved in cell wall biosynthesis
MKILMVGPGIMPIPSPGWGAVETIIWQQKIYLGKNGCHVDILNQRGLWAALQAKPWQYDLVHLHYDGLSKFWIDLSRAFKFPLVITTHYGYAACLEKWESYYNKIFADLSKANGLLVLSKEISQTFQNHGFSGWVDVLPNGTEVTDIHFSPDDGNGRAICLGKIEPRKNQANIATILNAKSSAQCDFVGPIGVDELVVDDISTRYLGVWSRQDVHAKLTDYSCLVLASDGEAHPLVVMEAMAAGLSIVVTPEATANLQANLPFVYVVQDLSNIDKIIEMATRENKKYRNDIRAYVGREFSWDVISARYVQSIENYLYIYHGKLKTNRPRFDNITGMLSIAERYIHSSSQQFVDQLRSLKHRLFVSSRVGKWNKLKVRSHE